MKKIGTMMAAMAIAALLTASAYAQPGKEDRAKRAEMIKKADVNTDGKVSYEELKAVMPKLDQERFAKMDRNKDGFITPEDRKKETADAADSTPAEKPGEAAGGPGGRILAKLKAADANGDGKLSLEEAKSEFPRMNEEMFKKVDKDGDGLLTLEEFKAALAQRMKDADTDKDGKVSYEEAKGAFPRMNENAFKHMDKNGDGFLSPDDRK